MNKTDRDAIGDAPPAPPIDFSALIAALRTAGGDQFDPMRLHYMDALAKRGLAHQGRVKRILDSKLAQALADFKERFEQAQCDARETIARTAPQYPHAVDELQRLFTASDFKGVRHFVASLKSGQGASLGALVRQLEQHAPENASQNADVRLDVNPGSRLELKTLRRFRNTWSKLSTDKQLTQALAQAPKNAGPINSHMLVLRSLALMRDISPDYLNRFMSYADTLLCLDQCEKDKLGNAKKPPVPKTPKK